MGAGNYIPRDSDWQNVFYFYVDKNYDPDWDQAECEDQARMEYDDILWDIDHVAAPHTYRLENQWTDNIRDAMYILAENGHYQIAMIDWGVYYCVAVGVIHQLGDRSAQSMEQKLIAQLGQTHDLYRRAGPWTSKKIEVD